MMLGETEPVSGIGFLWEPKHTDQTPRRFVMMRLMDMLDIIIMISVLLQRMYKSITRLPRSLFTLRFGFFSFGA